MSVQQEVNKSLSLSQIKMTRDIQSPLTSSLMILEGLMTVLVEEFVREKILLVIARINLLLCLVTDILDMKQIEQGKFISQKEEFSPRDVFNFVLSIFAS